MSKKIFITIVILLCSLLTSLCLAADPKPIRVGYFRMQGFNDYDSQGAKYGYGYEYLQEIAKYTNWQYEFVTEKDVLDANGNPTGEKAPITFNDCLAMLKTGELDLVGTVRNVNDRNQELGFPAQASGISYAILTARADDRSVSYGDLKLLTGKTIGILKSSSQNKEFLNYCQQNNININNLHFKEYDDFEKLIAALKDTQEVDILLTSSLRQLTNERIVLRYNPSKYYFVSNINNTELLKTLDDAHSEIIINNLYFEKHLYNKYYTSIDAGRIALTKEEMAYLARHPIVNVAVSQDSKPFEFLKDGNHQGIVADILKDIAHQLGITFNTIASNTYTGAIELVKTGQADLIGFAPSDYAFAEKNNLRITSSYMGASICAVSKRPIANIDDPSYYFAMVKDSYIKSDFLDYIQDRVRYFDTIEECINASENDDDCLTLMQMRAAEWYLRDPNYSIMHFMLLPNCSYDLSLGINKNVDPMLFKILNKAASNISPTTINKFIYNNRISYDNNVSLSTLLYSDPKAFFTIMVIAFTVILAIVLLAISGWSYHKRNLLLSEKNRQLKSAIAAADAANAAKSNFLAKMSHDIRTPLNAIISMYNLATTHQNDNTKILQQLFKADVSAKYLLSILNDILDMSKLEQDKLRLVTKAFSITQMMDNIAIITSTQTEEKNIALTFDTSTVANNFYLGDELRLQRVIMNLLSNSLKFTEANGAIQVSVTQLSSATLGQTAKLQLIVRDNGIGMSDEFLQRIFVPFEQENATEDTLREGSGLGLSIVYNIIHTMNGTIHVDSALNQGTTVTIDFDLPITHNPKQVDSKKTQGQLQFNNQRILLVEDNELNMEIAKTILELFNLQVDTAYNGQEAVDKFTQNASGYYDLIMTDLRMPILNGFETAIAIRTSTHSDAKTIPIIALSANTFEEDIEATEASGMNDHLSKPLDMEKLTVVLCKYLHSK